MMLKLTEHVGITIFLLYKQKTRWNSDIQNFYSEILNVLNLGYSSGYRQNNKLFFTKLSQILTFSQKSCFYPINLMAADNLPFKIWWHFKLYSVWWYHYMSVNVRACPLSASTVISKMHGRICCTVCLTPSCSEWIRFWIAEVAFVLSNELHVTFLHLVEVKSSRSIGCRPGAIEYVIAVWYDLAYIPRFEAHCGIEVYHLRGVGHTRLWAICLVVWASITFRM